MLAGGLSAEREISLRSGQGCFQALQRLGYKAKLIDLTKIETLTDLKAAAKLDLAFLCTHGEYGEDGRLQAVLDWLQVPYTGSDHRASTIAMSKALSKTLFLAAGLPVARGAKLTEWLAAPNSFQLSFPVILKQTLGGSSIGLHKIHSEAELTALLATDGVKPEEYLIEEFVTGREITVSLLERAGSLQVLPILELKSKTGLYDLAAKYTAGLTEFILPAPLSEQKRLEIESLSLRAFEALGCRGFGRVDFMLEGSALAPKILEINTLPGMTETSDLPAQAKAQGISYDQLVEFMLFTAQSC